MPYAISNIKGNNIKGIVKFYPYKKGTLVKLEVNGLPNKSKNNFFGFHIHEVGKCDEKDDYKSAGGHFDMEGDTHPNHTGDMPSIYSNDGYAYLEFYTNRFKPQDVINRSVIIHEMPDDLKTDPAGMSGKRIACGVIRQN